MKQHILFWYSRSFKCKEMKAQASLFKCVDAKDRLLHVYTKYGNECRIRPELVWLAPLHLHEQLMEEFANVIVPKAHVLVKTSFKLLISYEQ